MMDQGFEVRLLRKEDLCEESGFFQTLRNLRNEPFRDFEKMKRIFSIRLKRGVVTDVAVVDGKIVATMSTVFEPKFIHDGGWIAHIEDVATRKGHEGNGYATALLNNAIKRAREFVHEDTPEILGCYKIILDCGLEKVLLYAKSGFNPHELCMRMDL